MIKSLFATITIALILLLACSQENYPLPTPGTGESGFGANDTNYVELSPVWNNSILGTSLLDPHDITIGVDGIIYVADRQNNRVAAFSQAGNLLTVNGLDQLTSINNPTGVSVDSKLNVLISNQSDTVYCWNQYFNFTDLDSAAYEAMFYDATTNETRQMRFSEYVQHIIDGGPEMEIVKIIFANNPEWISEARSVYPIYVSAQTGSSINGVAAGAYGSELLYITESNFDKISEIRLVPDMAVKTTAGVILFRYRGLFMRDIAQYGSGAGTVDDPWAIEVDENGHIYFTQFGGNFRVQKLNAPNFTPAYVLGVHDIMDLDRFESPTDIELDDQNAIFVIDRETKTVSKFHNSGSNAGDQAYLGKRGLVDVEFQQAMGILAVDNIVYVLESGKNQIRRFQYSISDDDVPDDDKQP